MINAFSSSNQSDQSPASSGDSFRPSPSVLPTPSGLPGATFTSQAPVPPTGMPQAGMAMNTGVGGGSSQAGNTKPSLKPKRKMPLGMIVGVFALLLLLIGGAVGLYLIRQNQDLRQQASSGWCTGQAQCPAGWTWGGGETYCATGLKLCTEGGGGGGGGGGTPPEKCDGSAVTAVACRDKDVNFNAGPCVCRRTSGTLCACVVPDSTVNQPIGSPCSTNSNCATNNCANNVCAAANNGGGGGACTPTNPEGSCPTGKTCNDGVCEVTQVPIDGNCSSDASCGSGRICQNNRCIQNPCEAAGSAYSCQADAVTCISKNGSVVNLSCGASRTCCKDIRSIGGVDPQCTRQGANCTSGDTAGFCDFIAEEGFLCRAKVSPGGLCAGVDYACLSGICGGSSTGYRCQPPGNPVPAVCRKDDPSTYNTCLANDVYKCEKEVGTKIISCSSLSRICQDGACVPPITCGDNICSATETNTSCPADCGTGLGIRCENNSDCTSITIGNQNIKSICSVTTYGKWCVRETPSGCGNKVCDLSETVSTCPIDCLGKVTDCSNNAACGTGLSCLLPQGICISTTAVCGNKQCDLGESKLSCPADCGTGGTSYCDTSGTNTTQCTDKVEGSACKTTNNQNGYCSILTSASANSQCGCKTTPLIPRDDDIPVVGDKCTNDATKTIASYIKFTCDKCTYATEGGVAAWRCYDRRVDSATALTMLPGECGQVDQLDSSGAFCGYKPADYTCGKPECQTTQTTPPGNPTGPQCLSISMSNPTPKLNDSVSFTCGTVPNVTTYRFRIQKPDGTITTIPSSASQPNVSGTYQITTGGTYKAQCAICQNNQCQEFESLN